MNIKRITATAVATIAAAVVAVSLAGCSPAEKNTTPKPELSHSATPAPEKSGEAERPGAVPSDAQPVVGVDGIAWTADVVFTDGKNDITVKGQNVHCDNDVAGTSPSGASVQYDSNGSIVSVACSWTSVGMPETSEGW